MGGYNVVHPNLRLLGLLNPAAQDSVNPSRSDPLYASVIEGNHAIQQQEAARIPTPEKLQAPTVANVDPNAVQLLPHEKQLSDLVATIPNREDPQYQNSKFRTVLNAIAGGLAGIGNPQRGFEVGRELRDSKYNTAMGDFQNKMKAIEPVAKAEESNANRLFNTSKTNATLQGLTDRANLSAGTKVDVANAANNTRRDLAAQRSNAPSNEEKKLEAKKAELDKLQREMDAIDPNDPKAADKKIALLDRWHALFPGSDPVRLAVAKKEGTKQVDVKYAKPLAENTALGKLTDPVIAGEAKKAAATTTARSQSALDVNTAPGNVEKTSNKIEKETAAREKGKMMDDVPIPPAVKQTLDSFKDHPWDIPSYIAKLDKPTQKTIMKNTVFDSFITDPKAREIARTATATINHGDNMRKTVQDPWIRANLGAIAGRIISAEGKIGGDNIGRTPEEIRKEQMFLTAATNLLAFESKNLVGGRPAHQLWDAIKATAPSPAMGFNQIQGAIDGMQQSAEANIMAQLGKRPNKDNSSQPSTGKVKASDKYEVVK